MTRRVLYVMRHGHAGWDGQDMARELTASGRVEASAIGGRLRTSGIGHVLTSPAKRTRQTVAALGLDAPTEAIDDLYLGDEQSMLDRIRELDPGVRVALVVGHNPGVAFLVSGLADRETSHREALAEIRRGFATATCCRLEFDGEWTGLTSARLTDTYRPH